VAGLSEALGTRRPAPAAWCVSECLDHLATANRVYLAAMRAPAASARAQSRRRRRPARPGWAGGLFVYMLEPPPKWWAPMARPRRITPRPTPPLADAHSAFVASQADARAFLTACADLDLAGVRFPNPFVPGIRFSLATGLHIITSHERRHLRQAWRVRQALEAGHGTARAP
jgi:hypothetical protein